MTAKCAILSVLFVMLVHGLVGAARAGGSTDGGLYLGPDPNVRTVPVTIGEKTVIAVIADTDVSRARGLLGWERITDDVGMLLDFAAERQAAIHMQGMKFSIDAVWIDRNGVVTMIYESIQPNSGSIYPSIFPSRSCLELNAGFCKRYGVKIGHKVGFGTPGNRPR
ncbi:MAG: DUF192 domain-containing protein [Desulfomonile sp.]|nr:DUF192 domain-containing protein [Desulfomonile sp.]